MCFKCLGSFTALEDLKEHWLTHPELRAALPRTQQVILKENTQDLTEDFEPDINDPLVGKEMHEEEWKKEGKRRDAWGREEWESNGRNGREGKGREEREGKGREWKEGKQLRAVGDRM